MSEFKREDFERAFAKAAGRDAEKINDDRLGESYYSVEFAAAWTAWQARAANDKRVAELEMQNAMLKKGMDLVNAELADLKYSVRDLISDAHISGFVLEGGGERSIMYFVKGELIDALKRSLIQDDDK